MATFDELLQHFKEHPEQLQAAMMDNAANNYDGRSYQSPQSAAQPDSFAVDALTQGGQPQSKPQSQPQQQSLIDTLSQMFAPTSEPWSPPKSIGASLFDDALQPAAPQRLPPVDSGQSQPQRLPPVDSGQAPPQQQGILGKLQQLFTGSGSGSLSGVLDQLSAPRSYNGVPQPSYIDTALAAAIGLGTGGGLSSVGGLTGLQQIQSINDVSSNQIQQRNQQILDANSPAGQMRKTQQQFYASRMANDTNRYIDMISKDVNHTIPDQERDRMWGQITAKYAPLGLDPGPSPSQVQQWSSESASPDFRNAKMADGIRGEFGGVAGDIASNMLQSGATPKEMMDYHLKLQQNHTAQNKLLIEAMKADHEMSAKQVEQYRQRDLEAFKETGVIGGGLSEQRGSKMLKASPSYLEGQAAINSFHDQQLAALRGGTLASPTQFFGGSYPKDLSPKNFDAFVNQMKQGSHSPNSTAVHGDVLLMPLAQTPAITPEMSARAVEIQDPQKPPVPVPAGQKLLVRYNGKLSWLKSPAAL